MKTKAACIAFLTMVLVLFGVYAFDRVERQHQKEKFRAEVRSQLSTIEAKLEAGLNSRLFLEKGLIAFILTHLAIDTQHQITQQDVDRFAKEFMPELFGIRNITLIQNDIITSVYPLSGNEKAIGIDLSRVPAQQAEVQKVKETRKSLLSGPVDLVQGGVGIINRTPIYWNPQGGKETIYWGQSSLVIMQENLFQEAGLYDQSGLRLAIRSRNGLDSSEVFWGDEKIFQSDPVVVDVKIPSGYWQLAAVPLEGWDLNGPLFCWIWIVGGFISFSSGALVWFFIYSREIGKEIAKQKIDSLNQKFVRVFNASPTLMAIYREKDFMYVAVNDAWLTALGYERDEILGHSEEEVNTLALEEKQKSMSELVLGNTKEFQVRTKQGETRDWLMSKAQIQIDGDGCILLASVDITMSNHLEKEIARLDRLNLVGEMAASIGHEIRNPLTTVRGFLQFFRSKNQYVQDQENIDLMIKELDRANSIIKEFLSLSKNRSINLETCNPNKIIKELYPLMYATSVAEGIEIFLELDSVPDVLVDENEIRQLILNLTQNAREAILESGKIIISTSAFNDDVVLAVKDTGKGIPLEIYEKLGTPFVTTKDQGTGLGLAVCYRIADRHNARIEIDTSPAGTTFLIRFNAIRPA